MHHRSPPQLQPQTPLEGRLPRDCSRSIPISQTPWSIMHPSAWKVNSRHFASPRSYTFFTCLLPGVCARLTQRNGGGCSLGGGPGSNVVFLSTASGVRSLAAGRFPSCLLLGLPVPDEAALYPRPSSGAVRGEEGWGAGGAPAESDSRVSLLSLGGEKKRDPSPRYYIQRGQEPSGRSGTAGLPLTQERRAGSIARVPIVAILM